MSLAPWAHWASTAHGMGTDASPSAQQRHRNSGRVSLPHIRGPACSRCSDGSPRVTAFPSFDSVPPDISRPLSHSLRTATRCLFLVYFLFFCKTEICAGPDLRFTYQFPAHGKLFLRGGRIAPPFTPTAQSSNTSWRKVRKLSPPLITSMLVPGGQRINQPQTDTGRNFRKCWRAGPPPLPPASLSYLISLQRVLVKGCLGGDVAVVGIGQLPVQRVVIDALVVFVPKIHCRQPLTALASNQTIQHAL